MNFLNKIFPGSENNIRYAVDKGDNKPISIGRSVPITFIEDEPVAAIEQPTVENPVADIETGNEKIREIIENSFTRVFAVENNRDVRIFSQKKDKETTIGAYLKNGFNEIGLIYKLKEKFFAAYGKNEDVNNENVDNLVKNFCLNNVDEFNGSEDMKTAIKAVCNKDAAVEEEKVDEELKKDINNTWNKICDLADGLNKQANIDWESGQYIEDSVSFFKEEADKINALIYEINGRVKSDGSISEYSDEVLSFFQSHIEKLKQLQEEYETNKEQFKKVETKKDKQNFENCKKLIVNIFDIAKDDIEKTQFAVNLKGEEYYWENFDQIKTDELSEEDLKEFEGLVAGAKKEISKILSNKKEYFNKQDEKAKKDVEAKENERKKELEKKIKERFADAIEKIVDVSHADFETKYTTLTTGKEFEGDYREKIKEYLTLSPKFLFDAVDAHSLEERTAWEQINQTVDGILDENNDKQVIVVDGKKTYVIRKVEKEKTEMVANISEKIANIFVRSAKKALESCEARLTGKDGEKGYLDKYDDPEDRQQFLMLLVKPVIRELIEAKKEALNDSFGFSKDNEKELLNYILEAIKK
ncbi:MAG: hypothetical protein UR99_C0002G0004 [Candidatus Moranbacteria bacterium GW2011_GWD2_36_12]|nr:MAG: hypothetical protein UR99_C0002G0004 [Candidatus Moranbacteria bacterium GW2011_GWD2_36_12]KKQ07029.1 MAG: hypothetical protein US16_C0003G0004 [Candidatus Moranbacteria bacterium GW2011_GWE2_36_40]